MPYQPAMKAEPTGPGASWRPSGIAARTAAPSVANTVSVSGDPPAIHQRHRGGVVVDAVAVEVAPVRARRVPRREHREPEVGVRIAGRPAPSSCAITGTTLSPRRSTVPASSIACTSSVCVIDGSAGDPVVERLAAVQRPVGELGVGRVPAAAPARCSTKSCSPSRDRRPSGSDCDCGMRSAVHVAGIPVLPVPLAGREVRQVEVDRRRRGSGSCPKPRRRCPCCRRRTS